MKQSDNHGGERRSGFALRQLAAFQRLKDVSADAPAEEQDEDERWRPVAADPKADDEREDVREGQRAGATESGRVGDIFAARVLVRVFSHHREADGAVEGDGGRANELFVGAGHPRAI